MKIILLLLSLTLLSFSQSSNQTKINYKAAGIYFVLNNKDGKEKTRAPVGKDVSIEYDTFFKNYVIIYTNSDGKAEIMKLDFRMKDDTAITVVDTHGNTLYVVDFLEMKGTLMILNPQTKEGFSMMFLIENAEKIIQ